MSGPLEIAIVGDVHGDFDAAADGRVLAPFAVRLCTGDLTPNRGADRFDIAVRAAEHLRELGVRTILGNHDGPTGFTGRSFPKSYVRLQEALGPMDMGASVVELPEHDLTLVGARPLSVGGPEIRFHAPGREGWTVEAWAAEIGQLIRAARQSRIVVLAHCGPTGLGAARDAIYGCDFREGAGDWGDPDLALALDGARADALPVVAVVAGHMHHAIKGGGERARVVRIGSVLHVNAAVVPRVGARGRAITVLSLDGHAASARLEWHASDGPVERIALG